MDIKAKVEEIVAKIKGDEELQKKFTSDPVGAIESLIGVDLPNDQVNAVVDGVKSKLAGGALGGIADKIGGLFGQN